MGGFWRVEEEGEVKEMDEDRGDEEGRKGM